jgi:WhiB family redox-sensing transcriptional regulator
MNNAIMRWVRDLDLKPPSGGACMGHPTEWWFPSKSETSEQRYWRLKAQAICNECSVRQECLDYAIEAEEIFGIWGGLSASAREVETRKRRELGTLVIRPRVVKAL